MLRLPSPDAHQTRAIALVRKAWCEGARRVVCVQPCGGGKTNTAAHLGAGALRKGRRMLWLAHREELIDQAAATLRAITDVGIIKAGRPSNPYAPIQVGSVQTLVSRPHEIPDGVTIIVSDECHHDKADTRNALLGKFPEAELILGLTATPQRADEQGLGEACGGIYQALVVGATVKELQRTLRNGHPILVPFRYVGPEKYQRALFREPLEGLVEFGSRPDGSLRPALLFFGTIPESQDAAARARARGIRAAHVDGDTPEDERRAIFDGMREGRLDLICNVLVATEGTDLPCVEVVGVARGCSSVSTWIQTVMRAGRSCPSTGKTSALCIDYRGHVWIHGSMEQDRVFTLDGKGISSRPDALAIRQCPGCGSVFETAPVCPECGQALAAQRKPAVVAKSRAVEISPEAACASMSEKYKYFLYLQKMANERGWQRKAIGMRFLSKYGHWPAWLGKAAA